jgi:hypothetical protein
MLIPETGTGKKRRRRKRKSGVAKVESDSPAEPDDGEPV